MNAGYLDEAKAWREWLSRAVAAKPDQQQIMYGIAGERVGRQSGRESNAGMSAQPDRA
jgi:GH15 family glucan-1,4-alpha-glucosidase